jgi:hypothetical protein
MGRERPNANCLYCDAVLEPNLVPNRATYTCGGSCWSACNRSLNFFTPEVSRRRGESIIGLAQLWWVLRNSTTPLSQREIKEMLRATFGDSSLQKKKFIYQSLHYINDEYYSIDKSGKVHTFLASDYPFNKALRTKYSVVLQNHNV